MQVVVFSQMIEVKSRSFPSQLLWGQETDRNSLVGILSSLSQKPQKDKCVFTHSLLFKIYKYFIDFIEQKGER